MRQVRQRPFTEAEVQAIWARRRGRESLRAIARTYEVHVSQLWRLIAAAGGVAPAPRRRRATALTLAERERISRGVAAGESCRTIAAALGRAPSTVSRELARHGGAPAYRAVRAEAVALARARRPKPAKLATHGRLRAVVTAKLRQRWAPAQIAGWLRTTYPGEPAMQVSHETIYRTLFVQARGGLKPELTRQLRTRRTLRQPPGRAHAIGQLRDTVSIRERPPEVADRAVPGHWEGDLLCGTPTSCIATLVERSTRFVLLVALPHGRTAPVVRDALARTIRRLPAQLRQSLTWDHGKEMAEHVRFTVDTGVQVYFCDPHSPWQRGANENTNGLLRQYFPKGFDFTTITQADLNRVAKQLNGRPRATLGWQTPNQRFLALQQAAAASG